MRYKKLRTAIATHEDAERDIKERITDHKCDTKMGDGIYSRVQ